MRRGMFAFRGNKIGPELEEQAFTGELSQLLYGLDFAVDLGCGRSPNNAFEAKTATGFDLLANEANGVRAADLSSQPIPLPDCSADLVTAFDFLEHIPRWERRKGKVVFPFVDLMSEIYRVLKPGGFFYSSTPCYPARDAFQDPTHVNIISDNTLKFYFCGDAWAQNSGFVGSFELVRQKWLGGHLRAVLRKPASAPRAKR